MTTEQLHERVRQVHGEAVEQGLEAMAQVDCSAYWKALHLLAEWPPEWPWIVTRPDSAVYALAKIGLFCVHPRDDFNDMPVVRLSNLRVGVIDSYLKREGASPSEAAGS